MPHVVCVRREEDAEEREHGECGRVEARGVRAGVGGVDGAVDDDHGGDGEREDAVVDGLGGLRVGDPVAHEDLAGHEAGDGALGLLVDDGLHLGGHLGGDHGRGVVEGAGVGGGAGEAHEG